MQIIKAMIFILCIVTGTATLPLPIPKPASHYYCLKKQCNDFFAYCYAIKCLSESNYFLSFLDIHNYCYDCGCINQKDCIQIDSTVFFNAQVKRCIRKMHLAKSLKPLLLLSEEIKNHYHDQEDQLIHEFFLLVFTVHKHILLHECKDNPRALKHISIETILEISNKINQLPIAELLNAIDMLVTELPPFLEKYEFNSQITWKNWLKKYWWVPPVFGIWFGLRVLLSLQRHQFYYSSYQSYSPYAPKPQIPLQPLSTNDNAWAEIADESNALKVNN